MEQGKGKCQLRKVSRQGQVSEKRRRFTVLYFMIAIVSVKYIKQSYVIISSWAIKFKESLKRSRTEVSAWQLESVGVNGEFVIYRAQLKSQT